MKALAKWIAVLLFSLSLCAAYSASSSGKTQQKAATSAKSAKSRKGHAASRKGKRAKKASWRRGQQKMDAERARQIQAALIREHYLSGEPSGTWDQKSQNAMVRFQAENGWQTKIVPDSRALIKLGLGPSNDHLLNPESAMTSPLQPTSTEQIAPASTSGHSSPASTPLPPISTGSPQPVSEPQR